MLPLILANVLIIVADDLGGEYLSYSPMSAGLSPANTPTISALADQGIVYTNFWVSPLCSPTRASLLTGLYGHRTGVGAVVQPFHVPPLGLDDAEVTIAERVKVRGYETALIGKWHVYTDYEAPCEQGFDWWDGTLANPGDYWNWERVQDTPAGPAAIFTEPSYITDSTTDAALAWIQGRSDWLCIVAYHAVHKPFHYPPGMTGSGTEEDMHRANIEYLDSEIGRLLTGVDMASTTVFVFGDNGSPSEVALVEPAKGTAARGGIEVPLIVAGAGLTRAFNGGQNFPGQELDGHANVTDIFRTTLQLLRGVNGGPWPPVDSVSLLSGIQWVASREWNFSERAGPLGVPAGGPYGKLRRAAEENGYKLMTWETGQIELYDVLIDPWETVDLLEDGISAAEQTIIDGLDARVASLGL